MIALPRTVGRSALYPSPPGPPLRVAVLVAGTVGPGWLAALLRDLAEAEFLDLRCFPVRAPKTRPPRSSAFDLYLRADRRLLGELAPILVETELPPAGGGTDDVLVADIDRDGRTRLGAQARDTLIRARPDLLLLIGLPPPDEALAEVARLGAWTLEPEALCPLRCGSWMFSGFRSGRDAVRSGLLIHDARNGGWRLLEPGVCAPPRLSFARHRAYQLQKASARLRAGLRRIALGLAERSVAGTPSLPPGPLATLRHCLATGLGAIRQGFARRARVERWFIAVRRGPATLDPDSPRTSWNGFRHLEPPPDRFWADPCPWRHAGRDYVFVESLRDSERLGEIVAIELNADLSVRAVHPVMRQPVHLSYPFLFEWRGQPQMLVESALARRVSLFRCQSFPERWVFAADALSGWRAVDATVHREGDLWWLFVCVAETEFDDGGREWNDLFLFHADAPTGPWRPHPENPICRDVVGARPAGPLFRHDGRLIRPGQDCAGEYGRAVVFHEIETLSPDVYRERRLGTLEPDWAPGLVGCHLYARHGDLEVVDGKRMTIRGRPKPGFGTWRTAR